MPSLPGNTNPKLDGLCPFLGFSDDRDTALSYPSQYNCCYNAKPVVAVSMYHQRCFCLSKEFTSCPVYKTVEHTPLPKEIAGKYPNHRRARPWLALAGLVIFLSVVAIAAALMGIINIPGIPSSLAQAPRTQPPTFSIIPSATETTSAPTATMTLAVPTETIPSSTATVVLLHLLETPIGIDPQFILHRVLEGESFILLADTYNTSVEAIQAINFNMGSSLFAGRVIVIPVNNTDISTLLSFTVYEITADGQTIESLAEELNENPSELLKYNNFPEGYLLTKGEWLLIPR